MNQKVAIIIQDTPNGGCDCSVEFDPPFDQKVNNNTAAMRLAAKVLQVLHTEANPKDEE